MTSLVAKVGGSHTAVSYAGDGNALTNIARSGIAVGAPNAIVVNNGAGALSSVTRVDAARGGTGIDTSAADGIAKVSAGTWSVSPLDNSDLSNITSIARDKIAPGAPNAAVINDGAGKLATEPQLAPSRGGTGINTSAASGVAKVSAGTWNTSLIVDADVAAGAAIARSKIAPGVAHTVLINGAAGDIASEAQLAVSRGGTGADFSGAGVGPFALELSTGAYSTVIATAAATPNTYMRRDGLGSAALNALTAASVGAPTTLTINPPTSAVFNTPLINTASAEVRSIPTNIPGGRSSVFVHNMATVDGSWVDMFVLPTAAGPGNGTAYFIESMLSCGDVTGGVSTASVKFVFKGKNVGGVVTFTTDQQKVRQRDAGLVNVNAQGGVSGTNLVVQIRGVAAMTLNWTGRFTCAIQEF